MTTPSPALRALASKLLAWARRFAPRGLVQDVLVWHDETGDPRLAFYGAPGDLRRAFLMRDQDNAGHALELRVAAALGLRQQPALDAHGRVMYVVPQFASPGVMSPEGLFGMLSAMAVESLGVDDAVVTMIPVPGYPWHGAPTPYWSAATKKASIGRAPPWARQIRLDDGAQVPGVDWSALAAPLEGPHAAGWARRPSGAPTFLTHTFDPRHSLKSDAPGIARTGGWLFPSLALGRLPATYFGDVVLVADPELARLALRDASGAPSLSVYACDMGTAGTHQLNGEASAQAWREYTGQALFQGQRPTLASLGPGEWLHGGMAHHDPRRVQSVGDLHVLLDARDALWPRRVSPAFLDENVFRAKNRADPLTFSYYAEVKCNRILPPGAWLGAFAPAPLEGAARAYLSAAGYEGPLHVLPGEGIDEQTPFDEAIAARWRWAWSVADAIQARLPSRDWSP